jgi:nicotinate-nucleotide adenylyltransferase
VIFIPSQTAYIRNDQGKDFAFSGRQRLDMLKAIAADHPWMEVSDHELKAAKQPRTYDTLCWLRTKGWEPKLLMGSDKLPELETGWLHVREIAEEFGFAVMARNEEDVAALIAADPYLQSLRPHIRIIRTPAQWQHVSSSAVRRAIAGGCLETVADMIPPELDGLKEYVHSKETSL